MPSTPPSPRRPDPWNCPAAALLLGLSAWTLAADLAHQGHFLLQSSPSTLFLGLFATGWMFAAVILSVFPKRFLFPAILLASARLSFAWPVLIWTDLRPASLGLDLALVLLAAVYLALALRGAWGSRPRFRGLHSALAGGFAAIVSVLTLPAGLLGLAEVVEETSSGYVRITPRGVDLAERVFEREGRRVRLVGMAHIADGSFYENLKENLSRPGEGRRLVLLEGVSDREGILPESFASGATYRALAERFGLAEQAVGFAVQPGEEEGSGEKISWSELGVDFCNADIDVSDLRPEHRERLVKMLSAMEILDWTQLFGLPEGMTSADLEDLLVEGLVKQRNLRLLEILDAEQANYSEILVPWGAAHLPDLERRLLSRGYRITGETRRRGIDFWRAFP